MPPLALFEKLEKEKQDKYEKDINAGLEKLKALGVDKNTAMNKINKSYLSQLKKLWNDFRKNYLW